MTGERANVIAIVWCPLQGGNPHRLARLERTTEGTIMVIPESVPVYDKDDKHRSHVRRGAEAEIDAWPLQRPTPGIHPGFPGSGLACPCGEFDYPEDLVTQVHVGRRGIVARRL